ncbi:MAG: prepilin-type N-terminal cleavage/methylation domain-containing protein [Gemmataceae bacterium]
MKSRRGLTLVELMVVLAIVVAMAAVVIPLLGDSPRDAQATVTRASMAHVRDAYIRLRVDNPFRRNESGPDTPLMPADIRMADLFLPRRLSDNATPFLRDWNPLTHTGWNGPYLKNTGATYPFPVSGTDLYGFSAMHGASNDPVLMDGFSHTDGRRCPLVFTSSPDGSMVWVQSAGPNGVLQDSDDLTLQVYP